MSLTYDAENNAIFTAHEVILSEDELTPEDRELAALILQREEQFRRDFANIGGYLPPRVGSPITGACDVVLAAEDETWKLVKEANTRPGAGAYPPAGSPANPQAGPAAPGPEAGATTCRGGAPAGGGQEEKRVVGKVISSKDPRPALRRTPTAR